MGLNLLIKIIIICLHFSDTAKHFCVLFEQSRSLHKMVLTFFSPLIYAIMSISNKLHVVCKVLVLHNKGKEDRVCYCVKFSFLIW